MPDSSPQSPPPANLREIVVTLFELGREITSVLDLDELLQKIPQLISRLTRFHAFAVYLLDEKAGELAVAYSVGYPEDVAQAAVFLASDAAGFLTGQTLAVNGGVVM